MKRIAVFCGSSKGSELEYAEVAAHLGRLLADRDIGLVYGGGRIGLMGVVADAAMAAGGEVIGVMPEAMAIREIVHEGITETRIVSSMHERKAMMADLSDAFIAMPGGFGTFEEFCEIVTWAQLGLHSKPCALLNVKGYYDSLIALFDRGVEEGFIRQHHRALVLESREPESLLAGILRWTPSAAEPITKWIERDEV